jgi:gluconate kinase
VSFPADWIPVRFAWQQNQPVVEWCYLGRRRFTEPFFESTLQLCMRAPFNVLFRRQTPVEALLEWRQARPGVPPTGFIFHMSRCGSTLVAQMLAALPQNIVLSEASPIDDVLTALRAAPAVEDGQRLDWIRALVSALGQRRYPDERRLFIKFDCWHTQDLPLLRAAFPETPWIFLYRDPFEVMVSQKKSSGIFLVPDLMNSARFDFDLRAALQMPPEEYAARVLANLLQAALDHGSGPGGLLINYRQLPQAVTTSISAHFGVHWTEAEIERMHHITQFDAKNPSLYFTADQEEKQRAVTEAIARETQRWLVPLYERLEARRQEAEKRRAAE